MKMKTKLFNIENNSNIGIFLLANDKFCLGNNLSQKEIRDVEDTLGVSYFNTTILNSNFLGIYAYLDNDFLITSKSILENEKEVLKKICLDFDVKLILVDDKLNAIGNLICIGDDEFFCSDNFSKKTIKFLENEIGKKSINLKNYKFENAGSILKFFKANYLASFELDENSLKDILDKTKFTSVNKGSPFISNGFVCNVNGVLISDQNSTIEVQNILDFLGF